MNTQIGYALHCMQDYSSHGNIDVDTWEFASHALITGVDDPAYDWKNDSDRGKSTKLYCVYDTGKESGKRYEEAREMTVWCMVIFLSMVNS